MIFTVSTIFIAVLFVGLIILGIILGDVLSDDLFAFLFMVLALALLVLGFAALVNTWDDVDKNINIENSLPYLEELDYQREEIAKILEENLSNEDYVFLMSATVPDDIRFLSTRPNVDSYLLGRADRLVQINKELFDYRKKLMDDAKHVCNGIQNPFTPYLWIMRPDCELDRVIEVTSIME